MLLLGEGRINEGRFLGQHWKHPQTREQSLLFSPGPLPRLGVCPDGSALGVSTSFPSPGEPTA